MLKVALSRGDMWPLSSVEHNIICWGLKRFSWNQTSEALAGMESFFPFFLFLSAGGYMEAAVVGRCSLAGWLGSREAKRIDMTVPLNCRVVGGCFNSERTSHWRQNDTDCGSLNAFMHHDKVMLSAVSVCSELAGKWCCLWRKWMFLMENGPNVCY